MTPNFWKNAKLECEQADIYHGPFDGCPLTNDSQWAHIVPFNPSLRFRNECDENENTKTQWDNTLKQRWQNKFGCRIAYPKKGVDDSDNAIPLPPQLHAKFDNRHNTYRKDRLYIDNNGKLQNLDKFYGNGRQPVWLHDGTRYTAKSTHDRRA